MAKTKSRSIHQLLHVLDSDLSHMVSRSGHLLQLSQQLRQHLGTPLGDHIEVANINRHTVVLMADSPGWATRLRYQVPAVVDFIARAMPDTPPRDARVIVRPSEFRDILPCNRVKPSLSTRSAGLIQALADQQAADDPDSRSLREALIRLAANQSRS